MTGIGHVKYTWHLVRQQKTGRGVLEQHPFLCFVDHARIPQLLNVVHLLPEHSHGGSVALDGLEPLRGLNLPLHDERPYLGAFLHQLLQQSV